MKSKYSMDNYFIVEFLITRLKQITEHLERSWFQTLILDKFSLVISIHKDGHNFISSTIWTKNYKPKNSNLRTEY